MLIPSNESKQYMHHLCYFLAARDGNIDRLKKTYLSLDINVTDAWGWNALHFAAAHGRKEAVIFLLNIGVSKDVRTKAGKLARGLAYYGGYKEIVELLKD